MATRQFQRFWNQFGQKAPRWLLDVLNFVNDGLLPPSKGDISTDSSSLVPLRQQLARVQLGMLVAHGAAIDLDQIDAPEQWRLLEALLVASERDRNVDARLGGAVHFRLQLLRESGLWKRLRLCSCARWFLANDARQIFCSERCQDAARTPRDRRNYNDQYHQNVRKPREYARLNRSK